MKSLTLIISFLLVSYTLASQCMVGEDEPRRDKFKIRDVKNAIKAALAATEGPQALCDSLANEFRAAASS